jgi:hypothetical protein
MGQEPVHPPLVADGGRQPAADAAAAQGAGDIGRIDLYEVRQGEDLALQGLAEHAGAAAGFLLAAEQVGRGEIPDQQRAPENRMAGSSPRDRSVISVSRQEFVVGGYTDRQGNRSGLGALLLAYYDERQLRYAGKVGTGFDEKTLTDLAERLQSLRQEECPYAEWPADAGSEVHWVEPTLHDHRLAWPARAGPVTPRGGFRRGARARRRRGGVAVAEPPRCAHRRAAQG